MYLTIQIYSTKNNYVINTTLSKRIVPGYVCYFYFFFFFGRVSLIMRRAREDK